MTTPKRILVLEDDQALARQWRHVLEDAGFAVVLTDDADDAIEALRESVFDAVVLDMFVVDADDRILPRGGLTVMGEIRLRVDPAPPIIMVSAAVSEVHLDRVGILMDAYALLRKPVDNDVLVKTIREALLRVERR